MSHSITVTRTTTTTSGTAIVINTGYFKTWPGIIKLIQVVLGIVVVGLVSYYYDRYPLYITSILTFFLLMAVTFLIGTTLLVIASVISFSTGTIISKTIYEFIYHGVAFLLYLAASLALLIQVNDKNKYYRTSLYEEYFAASIIGLVLSALYLLSAILGYRSYKGL